MVPQDLLYKTICYFVLNTTYLVNKSIYLTSKLHIWDQGCSLARYENHIMHHGVSGMTVVI